MPEILIYLGSVGVIAAGACGFEAYRRRQQNTDA